MIYLKVPLRYLTSRDQCPQGEEWWDRATASLLKSLTDGRLESWATSYTDLAALTAEALCEDEESSNG